MLTPEDEAWAKRMKHFLDTHDYEGISQADLDKLHEHFSFRLRLLTLDISDLIEAAEANRA